MHDVGKPATKAVGADGRVSFHHHEVVGARLTKQRMKALRYPKDVIADVAELVALHLRFYGYGRGEWTDSAVRRYVTDAGDLLPRLHKLTRSDCTTRNRRKAAQLAADYDALEERIARIAAEEDLARVRPDLDGNAIMELLGVPPGPLVGQAWRHLKELRLERGPLDRDEAEAELLRWAARDTVCCRHDTRARLNPRPPPAVRRMPWGRTSRPLWRLQPVAAPRLRSLGAGSGRGEPTAVDRVKSDRGGDDAAVCGRAAA